MHALVWRFIQRNLVNSLADNIHMLNTYRDD